MQWVPFVVMVAAGILFLIAFILPGKGRFQALGLALLTAGLILQFVIKTNANLLIIH